MSLFKNRYFSQISVLINLLIIALVLILSIVWQIHVTHKEHDKFNNKIAELLANDIANRMQINYQESFKGKSSFYVNHKNIQKHINHYCDKQPDGCSPDTIAANDISYWQNAIHENLPHGTGKINIITNDTNSHLINNYSIHISWQDQFNHKPKIFTSNFIYNNHENN